MKKQLILGTVITCLASSALAEDWFAGERYLEKPSQSGGEPFRFREGRTPEGLSYRIYSDGSGYLSQQEGIAEPDMDKRWNVDCKRDSMNDALNCTITNYPSNIFIIFSGSKSPKRVCVLGHDFPGRLAQLRIDSNPAITTSENGCVKSNAIIKQLLAGNRIRTRGVEWPYDVGKEAEGSLQGLSRAIALVAHIHSSM